MTGTRVVGKALRPGSRKNKSFATINWKEQDIIFSQSSF